MANTALKFPLDLDVDNHPFIKLDSYSWNFRGKASLNPKSIKELSSNGTVILPAPDAGVQEQTSHTWDIAQNLSGTLAQTALSAGLDILGDVSKTLTKNIVNKTQRTVGLLKNDFAGLFYGGTDFRVFNFPFTLTPKSKKEAQALFDIYYQIKMQSTPDYSAELNLKSFNVPDSVINNDNVQSVKHSSKGFFIQYPDFWKIEVHSGKMIIFRTLECALVDIQMNYSPDGFMKIFEDGVPIKVQLNLSFKELQRYSQQYIQKHHIPESENT